MAATGRTIVFLSDFGYRNEWVGICHGVMNRIAPASLASAALGGVARAVEITSPEVVLTPISPSFHARDVLARPRRTWPPAPTW